MLVLVGPPVSHVQRPRPAQVVHKGARDRQGALFEVVVVVRRELVQRPRRRRGEHVDHEGGAPPDLPEAPLLGRDVDGIDPQLIAARGGRPRLQRRDVRMRVGIGLGVGAFRGEVLGPRGQHPHAPTAVRHDDSAVARRDDHQGTARDLDGLAGGGGDGPGLGVRQQQHVLVGLALALQNRPRVSLAGGDDEVLTAGEPGAGAARGLLRLRLIEPRIGGIGEARGARLAFGGGEARAGIGGRIHLGVPQGRRLSGVRPLTGFR